MNLRPGNLTGAYPVSSAIFRVTCSFLYNASVSTRLRGTWKTTRTTHLTLTREAHGGHWSCVDDQTTESVTYPRSILSSHSAQRSQIALGAPHNPHAAAWNGTLRVDTRTSSTPFTRATDPKQKTDENMSPPADLLTQAKL